MKKMFIATAILSLAFLSLNAQATMEAAWSNDPEGEEIHHQKPACPNFIMIKHKDGSTEEHIWSREVLNKRSAVDSGECVFY